MFGFFKRKRFRVYYGKNISKVDARRSSYKDFDSKEKAKSFAQSILDKKKNALYVDQDLGDEGLYYHDNMEDII